MLIVVFGLSWLPLCLLFVVWFWLTLAVTFLMCIAAGVWFDGSLLVYLSQLYGCLLVVLFDCDLGFMV